MKKYIFTTICLLSTVALHCERTFEVYNFTENPIIVSKISEDHSYRLDQEIKSNKIREITVYPGEEVTIEGYIKKKYFEFTDKDKGIMIFPQGKLR